MSKNTEFYRSRINNFVMIFITTIGISSQANEVAVFSGTGTLSDYSNPAQPSAVHCGADFEKSPHESDLESYQFRLFLGGQSSQYTLKRAEKILGLPLYDYNLHFQTSDGRVGEIQVTEKKSGKQLKIWGRIQRSNQDFFAKSETFFECTVNKVGTEEY